MANNHAGADHMVTIKMLFEGSIRRAKMPLRDMFPRTFEERIRTLLHIPFDTRLKMERWSDSLGSFVELDAENPPIYKQLYRAAKAKSKLKLRVTCLDQAERTIPRPVTVEDEPEATSTVVQIEDVDAEPSSSQHDTASETVCETTASETAPETAPEPASTNVYVSSEVREALAEEPSQSTSSPIEVDLPLRGASTAKDEDEARGLWAPIVTSKPSAPAPAPEPESEIPTPTSAPAPVPKIKLPISALASVLDPKAKDWSPPGSSSQAPPAPPANEWSAAISNILDLPPFASAHPSIAVCCNKCHCSIADAHWHCSTCDDGDYDLCDTCVGKGVTCNGDDHWLIKRNLINGQIASSSTEKIAPKPKPIPVKLEDVSEKKDQAKAIPAFVPFQVHQTPAATFRSTHASYDPVDLRWNCLGNTRTCNCCVQEFPEHDFLHCTSCEDFDLCKQCFGANKHGHHPGHPFVPAVEGTKMPDRVVAKLAAGRNQFHHAICDGCDKYIVGVRHKCLDCPDWDYCSNCVGNAHFVHPKHRFAPLYEPLAYTNPWSDPQPVHNGICCDGPLCTSTSGNPTYIRGIRYKCAVCHDTDFCANCEASPANDHNKTHPLIKFKTPVRHVSVTTTGEHLDGKRMPTMGDRGRNVSKEAESPKPAAERNAMYAVQTVVDVKPGEFSLPQQSEETIVKVEKEEHPQIKQEVKEEEKEKKEEVEAEEVEDVEKKAPSLDQPPRPEDSFKAVFIRDTVADGTILPPNHVFEQTWFLRNEGTVPWPAGCSVRFVGGDYMGHVDSAHPAGISELVSASESTVCYASLAPGNVFPFTVLLRTPMRPGRIISYWRLTTPSGLKFGHRLWCEVSVRNTPAAAPAAAPVKVALPLEAPKAEESSESDSVMIFPKLEKESATSSMHAEAISERSEPNVQSDKDSQSDALDGEWDGSDSFMTDEEYDILDASDEEFLVPRR